VSLKEEARTVRVTTLIRQTVVYKEIGQDT